MGLFHKKKKPDLRTIEGQDELLSPLFKDINNPGKTEDRINKAFDAIIDEYKNLFRDEEEAAFFKKWKDTLLSLRSRPDYQWLLESVALQAELALDGLLFGRSMEAFKEDLAAFPLVDKPIARPGATSSAYVDLCVALQSLRDVEYRDELNRKEIESLEEMAPDPNDPRVLEMAKDLKTEAERIKQDRSIIRAEIEVRKQALQAAIEGTPAPEAKGESEVEMIEAGVGAEDLFDY
ncbi:MAG: hypothetical protein E7179_01470 [Erysipelotrichaceae bacterium]|jgi:hypothetical protein|nr:hypothetical protein [Erysipelotrichaceae bacterium]